MGTSILFRVSKLGNATQIAVTASNRIFGDVLLGVISHPCAGAPWWIYLATDKSASQRTRCKTQKEARAKLLELTGYADAVAL